MKHITYAYLARKNTLFFYKGKWTDQTCLILGEDTVDSLTKTWLDESLMCLKKIIIKCPLKKISLLQHTEIQVNAHP